MDSNDIIVAHKFSSNHKEELQKDKLCGCFYCLEIFVPVEIEDWIPDSKGTAQCEVFVKDLKNGEKCYNV